MAIGAAHVGAQAAGAAHVGAQAAGAHAAGAAQLGATEQQEVLRLQALRILHFMAANLSLRQQRFLAQGSQAGAHVGAQVAGAQATGAAQLGAQAAGAGAQAAGAAHVGAQAAGAGAQATGAAQVGAQAAGAGAQATGAAQLGAQAAGAAHDGAHAAGAAQVGSGAQPQSLFLSQWKPASAEFKPAIHSSTAEIHANFISISPKQIQGNVRNQERNRTPCPAI